VRLANDAAPAANESMSLQLSTESGALIQIVAYQNETDFQVVSGGSWQTIHESPGGFINGVFQAVVLLSDLRDAVHAPVTPLLSLRAFAYSFSPSGAATQVDAAPDNGWMTVRTAVASTTTTTNPNPPYIVERWQAMAKSRVEWKRLAVDSAPANANVTIGCKKVCKLFEQLHVVAGVAVSTKFVGVPFPSGTTFVVRVSEPGNSGYWFSRTVVGKKGQQVTSGTGCIVSGTLAPLSSC
jgi:hypothetical protein